MNIHESAEDYLERVLMIRKRKGVVYSIGIVHELNFSKPSVSVAVPGIIRITVSKENRLSQRDGGSPSYASTASRSRGIPCSNMAT